MSSDGERTGSAAGAERTDLAARAGGFADLAAEVDEVDVEGVVVALRERGLQEVGGGVWRGTGWHQAQAKVDAVDVRVYGNRGDVRAEQQHACGGFAPDTGKRGQKLHRLPGRDSAQVGQTHLAIVGGQRFEHCLDPLCLYDRKPATADGVDHVVKRGVTNGFPIWKTALQLLEGPLRVEIGGVLREDSADQLIERRIAVIPGGLTVVLQQPTMNPPGSRAQTSSYL